MLSNRAAAFYEFSFHLSSSLYPSSALPVKYGLHSIVALYSDRSIDGDDNIEVKKLGSLLITVFLVPKALKFLIKCAGANLLLNIELAHKIRTKGNSSF